MVGISYNCKPVRGLPPHIQSMLLAIDRTGIDILLEKARFGECFNDWDEARMAETRLTHAILEAGYKV